MNTDELDDTRKDKIAAVGKAIVGAIPYIGGAASEAISQVPGLRIDRVTQYAKLLNERIAALEKTVDYLTPENIDAIEQGANQACHALSSERLEYIATLVVNAMAVEDVEKIRKRRLLKLLAQIDDDELLILNAYSQSYAKQSRARVAAWEKVDRPNSPHMGNNREQMDKRYFYDLGISRLTNLNLIEVKKLDSKGKPITYEISSLGRLFMREIGQPSPFDDRR